LSLKPHPAHPTRSAQGELKVDEWRRRKRRRRRRRRRRRGPV